MGIICVFQENAKKTQTIFCRTNLAVFCHFCRTNLALSDISCVFCSLLSDTSSCGHNWLCRTYLAGTGPLRESSCEDTPRETERQRAFTLHLAFIQNTSVTLSEPGNRRFRSFLCLDMYVSVVLYRSNRMMNIA